MANRLQMRCELIVESVAVKKKYLFSDRKVPVGEGEIEEEKSNLEDKLSLLILKKQFY